MKTLYTFLVLSFFVFTSSAQITFHDYSAVTIDHDTISLGQFYGKKVMVVETGMSWTDASTCNTFLADLLSKIKNETNGNGLGVFYWEPQSYGNWQGYTLGAFDNTGKPTVALNAFN